MKLPEANDPAEELALFRSEIVGGLVRRELSRGELLGELTALSRVRFRPPGSSRTRTYSVPTLQRWYYAYRTGGMSALRPRERADRGHARALPAELRELICQIRREYPRVPTSLILRTLVADGRMAKHDVSLSTVRRLYQQQGLGRDALGMGDTKVRLRWQAERPNALWHGDVCHGSPVSLLDGRSMPVRVHALLDDATRYIIAIQVVSSEREADMLAMLVPALRLHGAPAALYLDNGATYRGTALRLACERLGITLIHAQPYDAPARGKMERFWRTLRQGCLDVLGPVPSLNDIEVRIRAFVQQHYHQAPHAGLMGRAPAQIWNQRATERPAHLVTEEALREALTVRERRRVRRDCTVTIDGEAWELAAGFLANRTVLVCRSLADAASTPWVEHDGARLPLHRVDPVGNARRKRTRLPELPPPTIAFDPPGALLERAGDHEPGPTGENP